MDDFDFIVIGGGAIGSAIAYGLARKRKKIAVIDESDIAFRAAKGNFGLIWVQSKGANYPEYAHWTRRSTELWYDHFNDELEDISGIKTGYHRNGGLHFCFTEKEYQDRISLMDKLVQASGNKFSYHMEDRKQLEKRIPGIGKEVIGASYSPQDGHINPLYMLRALHKGIQHYGGKYFVSKVTSIDCLQPGFNVKINNKMIRSEKIVIAAGLGNIALAPMVGLTANLKPERGQILVTERVKPILQNPTILLRQTDEGGIMIGDSHEDVGFDDSTNAHVMSNIAARAIKLLPQLKQIRIIRAWGALRILTPDHYPSYDQSTEFPGAFTATSHSGITLAAAHATDFTDYLIEGQLPSHFQAFSERRFNVH